MKSFQVTDFNAPLTEVDQPTALAEGSRRVAAADDGT